MIIEIRQTGSGRSGDSLNRRESEACVTLSTHSALRKLLHVAGSHADFKRQMRSCSLILIMCVRARQHRSQREMHQGQAETTPKSMINAEGEEKSGPEADGTRR